MFSERVICSSALIVSHIILCYTQKTKSINLEKEMDIFKPSNNKEIQVSLTIIKKQNANYTEFCKHLISQIHLVQDFFSTVPYTEKHIELAAQLYAYKGVEVYKLIKDCFPLNTGKIVSSWDDFMYLEVKKLHHVIKKWDGFIADIESLCNDDLYVELMCNIARICYFEDVYDYVIDYEYIKRRYSTLAISQHGMRRFRDLIGFLADYDTLSAIQAWGDFYYLFERVYADTPPTKTTYTGSIYDVINCGIQHRLEIQNNITDAHTLFILADKKLKTLLNQYGWQYLHHLFEINSDCDWCRNWVYDVLPSSDKEKAKEALNSRNYEKKETITKNRNSDILEKTILKETALSHMLVSPLANLVITDYSIGVKTWINEIRKLYQKSKVSKIEQKKLLDDVLFQVYDFETQTNKRVRLTNKTLPLICLETRPIYEYLINCEELVEYYFRNFCQYGCATDLALVALYLENDSLYRRILSLVQLNKNMKITFEGFKTMVSQKMLSYSYDSSISKHAIGLIKLIDVDLDEFPEVKKQIEYLECLSKRYL